jgi:hypothetical protein
MKKSLPTCADPPKVLDMDPAREAIEEAEQAGFDLSLVDCNLELSYEDRLLQHDSALELVLEMRAAGAALYAQPPSSSATAR